MVQQSDSDVDPFLRLRDSSGNDDDIEFEGGNGVTVTRSSDDKVIFSSNATSTVETELDENNNPVVVPTIVKRDADGDINVRVLNASDSVKTSVSSTTAPADDDRSPS